MSNDTHNLQAQSGDGNHMDNSTGKTENRHNTLNSHNTTNHTTINRQDSPWPWLTVMVALLLVAAVAMIRLSLQPTKPDVPAAKSTSPAHAQQIAPESRLAPEQRRDPPLPAPVAGIQVSFDRADRSYRHGDKAVITITSPAAGYLYAGSVWADGQMRILVHPDLLKPLAGPVAAGQTVTIPQVDMSFTPPTGAELAITEEEIRVIVSRVPLPTISSDRRANIAQAWSQCGTVVGSPHEALVHRIANVGRNRGAQLPEPLTLPAATHIQSIHPYRVLPAGAASSVK